MQMESGERERREKERKHARSEAAGERAGHEHEAAPPRNSSRNEAHVPPAARTVACWCPMAKSLSRNDPLAKEAALPRFLCLPCAANDRLMWGYKGLSPLCLVQVISERPPQLRSTLELDDATVDLCCQSGFLHPTPRVVSKSAPQYTTCMQISPSESLSQHAVKPEGGRILGGHSFNKLVCDKEGRFLKKGTVKGRFCF